MTSRKKSTSASAWASKGEVEPLGPHVLAHLGDLLAVAQLPREVRDVGEEQPDPPLLRKRLGRHDRPRVVSLQQRTPAAARVVSRAG